MLDKLIAEVEKKNSQQTLVDQKFVAQQRILGDLGPRLWASLRLSLRKKCEEYPKHFTWQTGPQSGAGILAGSVSRFLQVEYSEGSQRIWYQVGEVQGEYRIGINSKNDAVFVDDDGRPYPGVEFVADSLLALLLPL
jgi:hypothetical protein